MLYRERGTEGAHVQEPGRQPPHRCRCRPRSSGRGEVISHPRPNVGARRAECEVIGRGRRRSPLCVCVCVCVCEREREREKEREGGKEGDRVNGSSQEEENSQVHLLAPPISLLPPPEALALNCPGRQGSRPQISLKERPASGDPPAHRCPEMCPE
jgi:hypothetical protein